MAFKWLTGPITGRRATMPAMAASLAKARSVCKATTLPPISVSAISAWRNFQSKKGSIMTAVNRRVFLGASAAWTAGFATAHDKKVSANEKVNVALIGCGGMGRANLADFMRLPDFEIAALCDIDPSHIQAAMNDVQKANRPTSKIQAEKDFRKIVERKDIDAVIVGTPDHWHA